MSLSLRAKILLMFGLLMLMAFSNFGVLLIEEEHAAEQQTWVLHTHQVIEETGNFLGHIRDTETGQRGFLLTDEQAYLEPYNIGISLAYEHFDLLKMMTRDNPLQQIRLETIQKLMIKKFAELEETVRLARQGKRAEALSIVKSDVGKEIMDAMRGLLGEFMAEEERLLEVRKGEFEGHQADMKLLFYVEGLVMIVLILGAGVMLQRTLVRPISVLVGSAKKLAAGEDVVDVTVAGDGELSELANAFNHMHAEVRDRTKKLKDQAHFDQSFSHAVTACSSGHDLSTALSDALIVHSLHHPSPLGAVYLYDEETSNLHCRVTHGTSDDVAEIVSSKSGLIGQVYRANEPLVVGADSAEGFHIDAGLAKITPRAVVLQPINYAGNMLGVLVLAYTTDLSERDRQYIANLSDQFGITVVSARQREKLKYEVDVKNKFFSIVAHDLKSPFTTLLGLSKIMSQMAENLNKDQLVEYAHKVNHSGEQVFNLLENLLLWAQMQMTEAKVEAEMISVRDIAQECIDVLNTTALEKDIMLTNKVEEATAYADRNMVQMIIRNLTANALKFTPSGGTIEVASCERDNMLVVTVSDSGIGMSKEHAQMIFALDQKTSTSGTAGETGTGLGLPLCKDMVEKNGGRIWFESAHGEGAQFHFTLPTEPRSK